jgi:hypothetical protein
MGPDKRLANDVCTLEVMKTGLKFALCDQLFRKSDLVLKGRALNTIHELLSIATGLLIDESDCAEHTTHLRLHSGKFAAADFRLGSPTATLLRRSCVPVSGRGLLRTQPVAFGRTWAVTLHAAIIPQRLLQSIDL